MSKKILITDSLFIFPEHEQQLRDAGYEIERLDKPKAEEAELIEHIKDKSGYILGGVEHITDAVIESAPELKAIVFTGADWKNFIPGHELAKKRNIAIANTPGANTFAVAEYTISLILAMTRNIFELGRTGKSTFQTTHSLNELTVGIVGMGRIGSRVARLLHALGAKRILYYSQHRKEDIEKELGLTFVTLPELLKESDIVSLHASVDVGVRYIGKNELALMKDGSLIVNCGFTNGIEPEALFAELSAGRLRAAQDDPVDDRFNGLPLSIWFSSNSHTAYNTYEANKRASDMAVKSLINLLEKGEDPYRVN